MIKIKNKDLMYVKSFLYELKLKPKLSRHRTKLVKILDDKIKDLASASEEIINLYAKKDTEGNPEIVDNKIAFNSIEDYQKFTEEDNTLSEEESVIDLKEYPHIFDSVKQALEELDIDLSESQAETYDLLCDIFNVD